MLLHHFRDIIALPMVQLQIDPYKSTVRNYRCQR